MNIEEAAVLAAGVFPDATITHSTSELCILHAFDVGEIDLEISILNRREFQMLVDGMKKTRFRLEADQYGRFFIVMTSQEEFESRELSGREFLSAPIQTKPKQEPIPVETLRFIEERVLPELRDRVSQRPPAQEKTMVDFQKLTQWKSLKATTAEVFHGWEIEENEPGTEFTETYGYVSCIAHAKEMEVGNAEFSRVLEYSDDATFECRENEETGELYIELSFGVTDIYFD